MSDYKRDLTGVPPEVLKWMFDGQEAQEAQGNKKDVSVFEGSMPTVSHIVRIKSEDIESLKCIRDSFKGGAWFNTMAMQVLDRVIAQTLVRSNTDPVLSDD